MNYIFITLPNEKVLDIENGIFKDLKNCTNLKFVSVYRKSKNGIINFCKRIIFSDKINSYIKISFKKWLYDFLPKIINKKEEYCFIIPTAVLNKIELSYIYKLKKEYANFKFVLLIIDSIEAHSPHLKFAKKKIFTDIWDARLTFDKFDAKKYNFQYFGYSYYSNFNDVEANKDVSDIYYIGRFKGGRENFIGEIFDFLKNKVHCKFKILVKNKQDKNYGFEVLDQPLTYPEVISDVKSTNCILEILQNDQKTQSLRYFEAVAYNKKLLSNNPNLHKLPFYNPKYMKHISSVADIDWEWVKKKEKIDYHYNNEFSPTNLLTFLDNYFKKV